MASNNEFNPELNAKLANESLNEADYELKPKEKMPYLYGLLGTAFIWSMTGGMLSMYWTDVLIMSPAVVALFLLVSKLWDAFNDPIIGYMADRTQTKWGRYKPWLFSFIPASITGWLCFTKLPGLSDAANGIFSMIMYLLYVLFYTMYEVPANGLIAAATTNPTSRGSIYAYRMSGSMVTGVVLSAITLPLIFLIGHDNTRMSASGCFWVALIYCIVAFPFCYIYFTGVRERVKIPVSKHKISYSFSTMKGNKPFWIFFIAFLIYGWSMASGSTRMYYWQYLAGDFGSFAPSMTMWSVGMAIGTMSYGIIVKKAKNKGRVAAFAFIGSGILHGILALFMLSPESSQTTIMAYHALTIIQGAINGLSVTAMYGVLPDITEYTQWKFNIRISGFITSLLNCSFKFGYAFGMAAFQFMLSMTGYVANSDQSPLVKTIINLNMHWLNLAVLLIAGLVMLLYKITNDEYYKMLHEIAKRDDAE
jgi:sugar (glycoside-pentoside-hexuronide) transporter